MLITAGMDRIPVDLPDAAKIDGATDFQVFRQITMPLLWEVLRILLVLWVIQALQAFTFIYVMTGSGRRRWPSRINRCHGHLCLSCRFQ